MVLRRVQAFQVVFMRQTPPSLLRRCNVTIRLNLEDMLRPCKVVVTVSYSCRAALRQCEHPFVIFEITSLQVLDNIGTLYAEVMREIVNGGLYSRLSSSLAPPSALINRISDECARLKFDEVTSRLKMFCTKLQVPFAQIWIPCAVDGTLITAGAPYYQSSPHFAHYRNAAMNIAISQSAGSSRRCGQKVQ